MFRQKKSPTDNLVSLLRSSGKYDSCNVSGYMLMVKLKGDDPMMIDLRGVNNTSSFTQSGGVQVYAIYQNAFVYKTKSFNSVMLHCKRGKENELKECLVDVANVV